MRWSHPDGPDVLVDIRRTSTTRDVRDGLLSLAYAVDRSDRPATGLCVIVNSRLTRTRLEAELDRFRAVVRPELAERVYLLGAKPGPSEVSPHPSAYPAPLFPTAFWQTLERALQACGSDSKAARVTRQQVKATLIERALCGLQALTLAELRRQTGASYQTASAALNELSRLNVIRTEREGPIAPTGLQPHALRKLADEHAQARQQLRYADPSGLGRTPGVMAERLMGLRSKSLADHVALSGVLGAMHHFPNLDITAAPRLDLSVYGGDLRFVAKLDAGLVPAQDNKRKPSVVLHLQRDCRPVEDVKRAPQWAARLDCLADLEQMGLQAEAHELSIALCDAARLAP